MQIVRTKLQIGIEKPFTFLHMTDTHLTCTDDKDSSTRQAFAGERREGLFPHAKDNIAFVRQYVQKTGYPLIHTGDLIDFITPENLRVAQQFAKDTHMLLTAGNHELHTCPNNVFCEADFTKDLAHREETLDNVQKWFENDIRFFGKEIHGVNLVGVSNADYQIKWMQLDALKEIALKGMPIVLFMHIPLYTDELLAVRNDAMLATPDEVVNSYSPFGIFEQRADAVTREAYDYIVGQPLIRCVCSGHIHDNFETRSTTGVKQLITGLDVLREITIV